ncbi:MAG: DNA recombination protein RmuC [Acidobacteria bacterium]|nr:DNA recombination protein RmuC [Acidobacteriota bacterium]
MSSALSLALLAIAAAAVLGFSLITFFFAYRAERRVGSVVAGLDAVARRIEQVNGGFNARLDGATGEMSRTLVEGLQRTTETLAASIGRAREETRARLDEKLIEVTARLGDLKATSDRIVEFSRSLDEFQRMLQTPRLRGEFGEFALEQMLADVIPAESYECQALVGAFRVDALVRTPHGALCIDSKFPLDNLRRALASSDPQIREQLLKQFAADVRGRIDEIAVRYISPPETLEMALMFVPAENVYYELLNRPELLEYARTRRVVAVSPNTMYAYLQALAIGFRGLKIQNEARKVEQMLSDLRARFERFHDHFVKIGRHLDNAQAQFAGAARDVDRFQGALDGLRVGRLTEEDEDQVSAESAGVGPS